MCKGILIKIQDKYKNALNQIETLSKEGAKKASEVAQINLDMLLKGIGLR